ncbi:FAD-dependent oxidoreductase [Arthrobacter sp. TWP1-1]|uniref:FAD-dependent oxidoreductase n=1 Tax=Arthrobacter sp. TWP1-1 TaxID=2804568 RepID=UPI003CED9983
MSFEEVFDVAVVGAGPAGLAAAVHAADAGLGVVLVDAGQQPGGQFWRHRNEAGHGSAVAGSESGEGSGHHDWKRFVDLRSRLYSHEAEGRLRYLRGTQLWLVESAAADGSRVLQLSPTVDVPSAHGGAETVGVPEVGADPDSVRASHLILCPGGYDRQLPVPGWDLPGVMAAGGVQALLKGNMTMPGGTGVVGGTGPFLLPVATALAAAGVKVAAVCEANSPTGWLRNMVGAVRAPEKAVEGVEYAAALARHRIPYRIRTAVTEIHGTDKVEAVTMSRLTADGAVVAGSGRRVPCDFVALGWGFTPSLELVMAVGADTTVDVDGSLVAVVDEGLNSTVPGVSVAGEATGIGGASMAVVEGELAALSVSAARAAGLGVGPRISRLQRERARLRAFAVAMHRANPVPARWTGWLTPETVVCRCEEVSYGELCSAHEELGAQDARSLKSFARPGMGWCQGRVCGFATAGIAADFAGRATSADDLRAMSKRTLAAPVSLGRLAALATEADEERTSS